MSAPEAENPAAAPEPSRCPRCQAALPADAPAGLCPACLVSAHFGTEADATEPAATAAPAPSVDELAPHFPQLEIQTCLGRGGMGVVYRARQKSLGRLVALKLLAPERVSDPAFAERFAREAQTLARLDHPHIVTIHDFGQAGGYYYLLMEYVDGVTLRQLVHGGRIAAREALAIVPQICDALQFAHDHGVVHRDIKPENILLDRRGQVKVADFGLAKLVGPGEEPAPVEGDAADGSSADITAAGHVMGTPRYMAPEQRERPTAVDHRADIYALGVVLYQMLTGELPGEKQLQPPSRRVKIDVRLDEIVLRALEQDPERRYASATEFKTLLETVATVPPPLGERGAAGGSRPPSPTTPPPPASFSAAAPAPGSAPAAGGARRAALEKLKPAATLLIVSSVLDLVGLALGIVVALGIFLLMPLAGLGAGVASGAVHTFKFWGSPLPLVGAAAGVAAILMVGWMLLNVAANIYVISAARRMMNGRDEGRARTAAIVAIVLGALDLVFATGSTAWLQAIWALLQVAAGAWAWVLLRQPEVREAFAAPPDVGDVGAERGGFVAGAEAPEPASRPETVETARRLVRAPSAGLMVAASAQLLLLGIAFAFMMVRVISMARHGPTAIALVIPVVALFLAGLSVVVLVGALRMRRLRGRSLAICAAVLAIVSGQGLLLGPIFGVWALVVLLRRDVSEAFRGAIQGTETPPERRVSGPATGLMVASGLQLLLLALVSLVFLLCVSYTRDGASGTLAFRFFSTYDYRSTSTPSFAPPLWYALAPAVLGSWFFVSGLVFLAALRMKRLKGYRFSLFGAMLAIVTLQGLVLGPILGLWALVVLLSRRVSSAFDGGRDRSRLGALFVAWICCTGLLTLVGVLVGEIVNSHRAERRSGWGMTSAVEQGQLSSAADPLPEGALDLAPHWTTTYPPGSESEGGLYALRGRREFAGRTMDVGGRVVLGGMKNGGRASTSPKLIVLPVGREFASLRLLHATQWQDPVGVEVATLRFVYADGEVRETPLRYGVHVIDWQRLPGEEAEPLSDPGSRFVWRGPAQTGRDASARAILTVIGNPRRDQAVREIEIVSRYTLASYLLLAASVSAEPEADALPDNAPPPDGARVFARELRLRVVDAATGAPVAGAVVEPGASIGETNSVTPPLFTDAMGVARLRYPSVRTENLSLDVARADYVDGARQYWRGASAIPADFVVRLVPRGGRPAATSEHKLSELIRLQGRQLAAFAALEKVGPADAEELAGTCAELEKRGACPGFVFPPAGSLGAASSHDLTAAEEERRAKEDELSALLRELGVVRLGHGAGASLGADAINRLHELARGLLSVNRAPGVVSDSVPATSRASSFAARLAAARQISGVSTRNRALAPLALEAAQAGDPDNASAIVWQIEEISLRNATMRSVALALAKKGHIDRALQIAQGIEEIGLRDKTLLELSQ